MHSISSNSGYCLVSIGYSTSGNGSAAFRIFRTRDFRAPRTGDACALSGRVRPDSGGSVVAAYLLVNLLLIIPVVASIVRALAPLEADSTGTRFTGSHSGWEIYTFTGWVTTAQSRMDGYVHGDGIGFSRVTDMLRLTDGTMEYTVSVDDFDVWLNPGQVATVCQAVNGNRAEYIAVINDSTGEQFYNERALWRVASPGFDRLLIALFAGLFFWLMLVAVIAWAVVVRSQVRRFQYIGVGPLLSRANSEASTLRKPWAA